MEKSYRKLRKIINHQEGQNYFTIFITLNYSNDYVPYIHAADLRSADCDNINVYRSKDFKMVGRKIKRRVNVSGPCILGHFSVLSKSDFRRLENSYSAVAPVNFVGTGDEIAVCYSMDFTNFLKRFKRSMKKYYNIELTNENFSYTRASEYGPTTFRPHFHALLYFSPDLANEYVHIKRAIIQAWPFCSYDQISGNIEVAKSASKYVSLYTVRPSDTPSLLQMRSIAAKSSNSMGFGFGNKHFHISYIVDAIRRENLTYPYTFITKEGITSVTDLRFPQYVMRRYFPVIPCRYLFDDETIYNILKYPSTLYSFQRYTTVSKEALKKAVSSLIHARERFGPFASIFPELYMRFDYLRSMDLLRMQYSQYSDVHYENYDIYSTSFVRLRRPSDLFPFEKLNPNKYQDRLKKDVECLLEYNDVMKKRKTNEYASRVNLRYVYIKGFLNQKNNAYAKHSKRARVLRTSGQTWT